MKKLLNKSIYILTTILLLTMGFFVFTEATDNYYDRKVKATDNVWNTSPFTESRRFTIDETDPYIYFTGDTPTHGTITGNTFFQTGQVEVVEDYLRKFVWNRNGTDYIFDLTWQRNNFWTGDYSLTDYTDTGLILAMNFDTTWDTNDYSIYWNNGTNSGATWTGDGKYNWTYNLDGIDDFMYGNIDANNIYDEITVSFRENNLFCNNTYDCSNSVFSIYTWSNNQKFAIWLSNWWGAHINRIVIYGSNIDGYITSDDNDFTQNRTDRRLVTITYKDPEYKIYYNGVLKYEKTSSWGTINGAISDKFKIWRRMQNGNYLDIFLTNKLDDIRVYNYSLTSWQIAQIYNTTVTKYSTGLRGLDVIQTGLADGTYTYQSCAEDQATNTGCTETRNFTVDTTDPYIYFTGDTPVSGYISSIPIFTGEIETIESNIRKLIRNRNGTDYVFDLTWRLDDFWTGKYSLTDYADDDLLLAINYDKSWTIIDYSQYNHTIQNHNASWETGWAYNWTYFFDGDDDYMTINSDDFNLTNNFTVSVRAKFSDTTENHHLLSRTRNWWWLLQRWTNNHFYMTLYEWGYKWVWSNDEVETWKWYNIVWQVDELVIKIYVDGVKQDSEYILSDPKEADKDLHIGSTSSLSNFMNWPIDNIRIWKRVLSPWEIKQLYNTTITKYSTWLRGMNITQPNLPDGHYTYKACAEDQVWLTGCTDNNAWLRDFYVQTPKQITVKMANQYMSTWDFRLFEQTGTNSWREVYNSSQITTDTAINIDFDTSLSTGLATITGQIFPSSGSTYLAVFKLEWALAVGYTGIWQETMTWFDFSDTSNNILPEFAYDWQNYLYFGDVDQDGAWEYDYIHGADFTVINNHLTLDGSLINPLHDFDYNNVVNALEQAMIISYLDVYWFLQTNIPNGLELSDFKTF